MDTDRGRGDASGEESRMGGGGRREPQGRMPSCLANERQAVEAPSTLLTSSFVLHSRPSHAPNLSLSETQNAFLLRYRAGGLFLLTLYDTFREQSLIEPH